MTRRSIEIILDNIGIPMNLDGYYYLISAVYLKKRNYYSSCELYIEIACIHHTSASNVERSIRYIHNRYNLQIKKYFKLNCHLNNSVFIEALFRKCVRG